MHESPKTAILFFSRTPAREAMEKSAAGRSYSRNKSLQRILWKHSLSQLRSSGLPVVVFDESRQRGADFAERFQNAISDFFDIGYENVIAVGNDCLELTDISWTDLAERLRNNETVLGPTSRYGAYLIAFSKQNFDADTFRNLPWRSDSLLDSLIRHFHEKSDSVHLMGRKTDINSAADIDAFLRKTTSGYLKKIRNLLIQLFSAVTIQAAPADHYRFTPVQRKSSRAPPLSC